MEKARKKRIKKEDIGYGHKSTFPSQLRSLLKEEGGKATQEDLAVAIGVSRQSVAQWKDGNTMPNIHYLKKIADFFSVPYEYLLDGTPAQKKDNLNIAQEIGLDDSAIKAIKSLHQQRQSVLNKILASPRFPKVLREIARYKHCVETEAANKSNPNYYAVSAYDENTMSEEDIQKVKESYILRDDIIELRRSKKIALFDIQDEFLTIVKEFGNEKGLK